MVPNTPPESTSSETASGVPLLTDSYRLAIGAPLTVSDGRSRDWRSRRSACRRDVNEHTTVALQRAGGRTRGVLASPTPRMPFTSLSEGSSRSSKASELNDVGQDKTSTSTGPLEVLESAGAGAVIDGLYVVVGRDRCSPRHRCSRSRRCRSETRARNRSSSAWKSFDPRFSQGTTRPLDPVSTSSVLRRAAVNRGLHGRLGDLLDDYRNVGGARRDAGVGSDVPDDAGDAAAGHYGRRRRSPVSIEFRSARRLSVHEVRSVARAGSKPASESVTWVKMGWMIGSRRSSMSALAGAAEPVAIAAAATNAPTPAPMTDHPTPAHPGAA